jgi:hypothetical protein
MANQNLRLVLSASDLKALAPDWPDALINDYIEIFAELESIITELNQAVIDINTLLGDYNNLNADLGGVRSIVSMVKAKVNRFGRMIEMFNGQISDLQQQAGIELGKIKSRLYQSTKDYKAWLPSKAALLTIEGNGAVNPTLTNSYNIASVTRTGAGVYQATLTQSTYFTQNILNQSVFALSKIIGPLAQSYDVDVVVTSATTFEIRVYRFSVVLTAVQRAAYDLLAGDFVSVQGLYSINSSLPPR